MVQAAGMYTTLLQADEPAVVIECLNGYRLKENLPTNLGSFTVPLGRPEILRSGTDATVVSYGSTLRIVMDAAAELERFGISIEVVDVQTLLPFDLNADCVASLKRTNRLLVVDEDVPGGAAAYLMQQILEEQDGYRYLDAAPRSLTAKAHRPAYGSDGDYFSKPSAEDVVDAVLELVGE
jgi:pyruvate/2-oxoglutarate/acetoin dehydrogenase E1 component